MVSLTERFTEAVKAFFLCMYLSIYVILLGAPHKRTNSFTCILRIPLESREDFGIKEC